MQSVQLDLSIRPFFIPFLPSLLRSTHLPSPSSAGDRGAGAHGLSGKGKKWILERRVPDAVQ
jgi:hypothetical protein